MKKIIFTLFFVISVVGKSAAYNSIECFNALPTSDKTHIPNRHAPIHKWHPTISIGYTSIAIDSLPNNATITLTLFDENGLTIYNRCVTASSKFTFEIPFEVLEDAEKIMVTINGQTFFV